MARPLRIEYSGAWYHVMNRGAGRRTVFPDDGLRRHFLSLLGDVRERYAVRCHAYCLMDNHYHLLMQTPEPGLGRAMRHVDGVYTQRHNRRLQTDGPLFRGRYKAQLIEDGEYLWVVSRYIHRNPVTAGLCARPTDYAWSSYRFVLGMGGGPVWLERERTLAQFGGVSGYRGFVEGDNPRADALEEQISACGKRRVPPILGSQPFIDAVLEMIPPHDQIPDSRTARSTPSAEAHVAAICAATGWSPDDVVRAADKEQRYRRALIMTTLSRHTAVSLADIGAVFGLSVSTVASAIGRFRRSAERNVDRAEALKRVRETLRKTGNCET